MSNRFASGGLTSGIPCLVQRVSQFLDWGRMLDVVYIQNQVIGHLHN
jgi:hypothetical protein